VIQPFLNYRFQRVVFVPDHFLDMVVAIVDGDFASNDVDLDYYYKLFRQQGWNAGWVVFINLVEVACAVNRDKVRSSVVLCEREVKRTEEERFSQALGVIVKKERWKFLTSQRRMQARLLMTEMAPSLGIDKAFMITEDLMAENRRYSWPVVGV